MNESPCSAKDFWISYFLQFLCNFGFCCHLLFMHKLIMWNISWDFREILHIRYINHFEGMEILNKMLIYIGTHWSNSIIDLLSPKLQDLISILKEAHLIDFNWYVNCFIWNYYNTSIGLSLFPFLFSLNRVFQHIKVIF